ncbi:MAG: AI-2E family transporter [Candidatus Neomarinimicrobiota bacterium]
MDKYAFQLYSLILKNFWRVLLIFFGITAIIIVYPYVKSVLLMVIISWIFAMILMPAVDFMESKGLNRGIAIIIVMIAILIGIVTTAFLVFPAIIRAVDQIKIKLESNVLAQISIQLEAVFKKHFNNPELARNVTTKLNDSINGMLGNMSGFLNNAGSFAASLAIIPFVTFFLIKDTRLFKRALISRVPNKYFELSLNVLHKISDQLSKYIQGQALDAAIVGALSVIGLFSINLAFDHPVSQFVFIGLLAGIANLIPYLGPVVGAVPAMMMVVINNPANMMNILLWIAITFALVQFIDNMFVSPLVVSKSVNMHPLTVVIVVIIGGNVAGAIGMLFAVPTFGIIKVTLTEIIWGLKNYKLR